MLGSSQNLVIQDDIFQFLDWKNVKHLVSRSKLGQIFVFQLQFIGKKRFKVSVFWKVYWKIKKKILNLVECFAYPQLHQKRYHQI